MLRSWDGSNEHKVHRDDFEQLEKQNQGQVWWGQRSDLQHPCHLRSAKAMEIEKLGGRNTWQEPVQQAQDSPHRFHTSPAHHWCLAQELANPARTCLFSVQKPLHQLWRGKYQQKNRSQLYHVNWIDSLSRWKNPQATILNSEGAYVQLRCVSRETLTLATRISERQSFTGWPPILVV